jgi:hypothetical protein
MCRVQWSDFRSSSGEIFVAAFTVILGDLAKGVLEDIRADVLSDLFSDSS